MMDYVCWFEGALQGFDFRYRTDAGKIVIALRMLVVWQKNRYVDSLYLPTAETADVTLTQGMVNWRAMTQERQR